MVVAYVRAIYTEASMAQEHLRKEIGKHAARSDSAQKIKDMLNCAKSKLSAEPSDFDRDAWLLNCKNGVIDLKTGKLRQHRREDMITKLVPVSFDPNAACPRWEIFLTEILDGRDELLGYIRRLIGICLTGDISEQFLPIFYGGGANGKSTFIDTIVGVMGDYAADAPPTLLISTYGNDHPTDKASLLGKRLVCSSEIEERGKLRVATIKKLTGDTVITARFMRQDFFSFLRTHKLVLVTNHKPAVGEQTHAIWRRIHLVPFTVTIPPEKRNPHLLDELHKEWEGILAWCVRGCLEWQQDGLKPPPIVIQATSEYRREEDLIGTFMAECCEDCRNHEATKDYSTSRTKIYASYQQWCNENGEKPLSSRKFGDQMKIQGFVPKKLRLGETTKECWLGLILKLQEGGD